MTLRTTELDTDEILLLYMALGKMTYSEIVEYAEGNEVKARELSEKHLAMYFSVRDSDNFPLGMRSNT